MIIEVTRETTTIRWREVPIPSRCEGCPYPHVGFTCRDRDGSCLRTDVEQLTERQKKRRRLDISC